MTHTDYIPRPFTGSRGRREPHGCRFAKLLRELRRKREPWCFMSCAPGRAPGAEGAGIPWNFRSFTGSLGVGGVVRLLVVEDDRDLNRQLVTALSHAGYAVDSAFDGEEGQFLGDTEPYDAIILDLGLPKLDGLSVLEGWRRSNRRMPVLILTARDRWSDKVAGMDAGADDYVAKPFHIEEVLARVRALLRRSAGLATSEIECGPLRLDTRTARVTLDGTPVKLTSLEYRLLAYLMHHQSRVVPRLELVEHLYEQDFDRDSNTIEVFVGRLRKKIPPEMIKTVRGLGYRLSRPDDES